MGGRDSTFQLFTYCSGGSDMLHLSRHSRWQSVPDRNQHLRINNHAHIGECRISGGMPGWEHSVYGAAGFMQFMDGTTVE